jgi:hypothetical protein
LYNSLTRLFYVNKNLNPSSAILQETCFKQGSDIYDFLPWWGIIGFFITIIESVLFGEFDNIINKYIFDFSVALLFLGFVATLVVFTSISPFFIKRCTASMFNISLVSQIFWSYLLEISLGHADPGSYFYYIGFVIIVTGIFLYNKSPVECVKPNKGNTDLEAKLIGSKGTQANENYSETSSCSAFSIDRKYSHLRNNSLHIKANKYLTNNA